MEGLHEAVSGALDRALDRLAALQEDRGCWAGEVKWCTVLLSQRILVAHVLGDRPDAAWCAQAVRHFRAWQTADGGFGLHADAPANLFVTALGYVALRVLGVGPDHDLAARARAWMKAHGGVLAVPTWGKLWLAMFRLYGWEGVHPMPPELWLAPAAMHPSLLYNHTRLILLGMSYLWGRRFVAPDADILREIRDELYDEVPYDRVDFRAWRHVIAQTDVYVEPPAAVRAAFDALAVADRFVPSSTRQRALDTVFDHMVFEARSTAWACVSPVSGLLGVLAMWDRGHPDLRRAWEGVEYWRWEDDATGIRYNGAHSHSWDTAFAIQAVLDGPARAADRVDRALASAYRFLDASQMREEIPDRERWYRDRRLGGWCFSDAHHQWPVSDCTAEALVAILRMEGRVSGAGRLRAERLAEAAEFVLSRQNDDGGFGSYERRRGGAFLERLNPTEMFGNCMTELSYVECTASCVASLAAYRPRAPGGMRRRVDRAVERGVRSILAAQRPDGSWEGAWGVNFTYGIAFAVEGLMAAGLPGTHPAVQRACAWLLAHRHPDGGWGEDWRGCVERRYIPHERPQVIMTAWALMTLLRAGHPDRAAVDEGVRLLLDRQLADGDWPEEGVAGVFFHTAMHHYCLYKTYFPIRALGRWLVQREEVGR